MQRTMSYVYSYDIVIRITLLNIKVIGHPVKTRSGFARDLLYIVYEMCVCPNMPW